jgi:cytochrome b561
MTTTYTKTAITFHWLTVFLILSAFPLGVYMHGLAFSPLKLQLYSYHKWLGVTILMVTLMRLGWRLTHTPPPMPASISLWQQRAAEATHLMIYLMLLSIPVVGWLMSSAKGVSVVYLGLIQLPDLVDKNKELGDLLANVHQALNLGLLVLVMMHIAAVLKHHYLEHDAILHRMLPFLEEK